MTTPLIVFKDTKLEWDTRNGVLPEASVIEEYKIIGANWETILSSHQHQLNVRSWVKEYFPAAKYVLLSELIAYYNTIPDHYDLVISIGGDNSFTCIGQKVTTQPLLGITADPIRSQGVLNDAVIFAKEDVERVRNRVMIDRSFLIEEWSRIQVEVNDKVLGNAVSEVFLGERLRKNMSRYLVDKEEYKSSGLIVHTGAGSTGWAASCGSYQHQPTERELRFIHTEIYKAPMNPCFGTIGKDMVVRSLNDDGVVSLDSWTEVPFNRGAVAKLSLGPVLNVIRI